MRSIMVYLLLFPVIFIFGCDGNKTILSSSLTDPLPENIVGVWKADENNWGFKLEPDGTVSKMVHNVFGPLDVLKGGIEQPGTEPNTGLWVTLGRVNTNYNAKDKELSIEVFVDHFEIRLPAGSLIGREEDYLSGEINPEQNVWVVEWMSLAWMEGASDPDPNPPAEKLTFHKIETEKIEKLFLPKK